MNAEANINGNKFQVKNGKCYLNGKEIEHNVITHRQPVFPLIAFWFTCGMGFMLFLTNIK